MEKPKGNQPIYRITYEDCRHMVDAMEDSFHSDVFGVEKEKGKVEGILAAVYQSIFGKYAYPSLEEKAANLLYFMIKERLSDGTLVAVTLMIAESNPEEKEVMVKLVMNLLNLQ